MLFGDLRDDVRVKIAIGAFADAVGDVNVKRKGACGKSHLNSILCVGRPRCNLAAVTSDGREGEFLRGLGISLNSLWVAVIVPVG